MFGLEKYSYTSDKTLRVYSFISNGPSGPIRKIAKFTKIGQSIFNFGFGDLNPMTNDISDTSISNNQDTDVVMGTLGSIIYDFTNLFLDAAIFIQGTNRARTRLYQMNINKHWERILPIFEVFGLKEDQWEPFKKGVNYDAFLGRRKSASFVIGIQ
ncbi:MAG TPA: hypothetical protein VHE34_21750 [Puia sp.]|uniref:DUF6934 family protein n=1 Tax=Puia sp. TaxID=2045100 RepID=UPI002BABA20E|nr:hypothetical protein [Puia sp.]HVU97870.1 hypothetical protein [Puia sp.]